MTPDLLLQSSLKVSGIVIVSLVAAVALRRRSAALRHWILAAAIVCATLAPALERFLPAWHVPLAGIAQTTFGDTKPAARPETATKAAASGPASRASASPRAPQSGGSLVLVVWLAGASVSALMLVLGLGRLGWIAARATLVTSGPWKDIVDDASREYGLRRRVRVLQSGRHSLLVTWGLLRPSIILPPGAEQWTADRIRIVALHELAHVARGDWAIQIVGEALKAANWFNPLVWIACRRLRDESEHAADNAVLNRGVGGTRYAEELLALARAFVAHRQSWLPAPAIARTSSLERRVRAMLSAGINRQPASRVARVFTSLVLVALAVAIASAQSVFSSFSGGVYDQMNGLLPNTKIALTNTQTGARYEIRSDRTGHFEFVGLPPGQYAIETDLPGFMALKGALEIAGQNVQRDVRLQVGSLTETVSVSLSDAAEPTATKLWRNPWPPATPACSAGAADATGGIGGNIRPPKKLVSVKPDYPANLRASRQEGVVVLEARIGEDGTIREVRTVASQNADFESAAIDAVRQWEFSQTLLNCRPIEVMMTVTVRFSAE